MSRRIADGSPLQVVEARVRDGQPVRPTLAAAAILEILDHAGRRHDTIRIVQRQAEAGRRRPPSVEVDGDGEDAVDWHEYTASP